MWERREKLQPLDHGILTRLVIIHVNKTKTGENPAVGGTDCKTKAATSSHTILIVSCPDWPSVDT
jgi:hypothetical protein